MVFKRLMVDGHAEWSADLVLTCIALSDIAAVVKQRSHPASRLKAPLDALGHFNHLWFIPCERNDGNFYGSQIRVQVQNRSFFSAFEFLLFISVHKERQRNAVH